MHPGARQGIDVKEVGGVQESAEQHGLAAVESLAPVQVGQPRALVAERRQVQANVAAAGWQLSAEELAEIPSAPGSLAEALEALKADQEFLMKGDVFTQDAIDMWIDYKTENEINDVKLRPHPHEFYLYYDI